MTRDTLISKALLDAGDTTLTTQAAGWIDDILGEVECAGNWQFLETSTTYQTENGVSSVALSAAKFPSAAIADYSKGISISSITRKLAFVPKEKLDVLSADGSTGSPTHFSLYKDTIYFYPSPVTGSLPLLTIRYFKQITLPTQGSDNLLTVCGLKPKYQYLIKYGVVALAMAYRSDPRFDSFNTLWGSKLQLMLTDNTASQTPKETE